MPRSTSSPARRARSPRASPKPKNGGSNGGANGGHKNGGANGVATAYAFDDEPMQFGGTVGALFIMLFSHALLYYLYLSLELHGGALFVPTELSRYAAFLAEHAVPTASEVGVYAAFIALQTFLALVLPGLVLPGLPVRSLGGKRLDYNCNGWAAWVVTQLIVASLHFSGTFSVEWAADHYGALLTTMVCTGDAVALAVYAAGFLPRVPGEGHAGSFRRERMTGSHVYDFFMGASLNPRFGGPRAGGLDIKMWAEVRVSWITLFLLTLSAATKAASERGGEVGASFWIMLMAHWLYTNACVKGEECIITTWDIAHEKWGWMLCFWNLAGVPILYTWNCMYLLKHPAAAVPGGPAAAAVLFVLYLCAYFVWDTANSQKNYFRLVLNGTYKPRPWYIFPQLPWKVVQKPAYIRTKAGTPLLVDGWWKYARKIHYTMDICFALCWGLVCGTTHFLPYFYFCFFTGFITHRASRDHERCAAKYGDDWRKYTQMVPYVLIPGVW